MLCFFQDYASVFNFTVCVNLLFHFEFLFPISAELFLLCTMGENCTVNGNLIDPFSSQPMKEEPSDTAQAFDADDQLISSILLLKEEPSECGIKEEPTESAFQEVGSCAQSTRSQRAFYGESTAPPKPCTEDIFPKMLPTGPL